MDSVYNSYDLTYKSLRWMYTIVAGINSSEIKTFSQYFTNIYYKHYGVITRDIQNVNKLKITTLITFLL